MSVGGISRHFVAGHRGAADIDQAAPINLDYEYAPVTFALARQPKNRRQKDAIVPYCG
jgi:hypothetical protein